MMRTIVTFERLGTETTFKLDDAPLDIPGLGENLVIDISHVTGGTLVERGEALIALLNRHEPIRAGLGAVLASPPGSAPSPLYFHVRAASADALEWEQIYAAPYGFCALDKRWPVGRIAARSRPVNDRTFTPPLRIVAVLSAAGRSGVPQLQAILAGLRTPEAAAIGVSLHVISGEEAVLSAAVGPGVTSELIAATVPGLARQITRARPHILHTLCHGGAVAGLRTLAFAHLGDFEAGIQDSGSVRLSVPDLVEVLRPATRGL